jgi:hypothetical protein
MEELAVMQTKVQKNVEYTKNYADMLDLVNELNDRLRLAAEQGKQREIERHLKRGQLLGMHQVDKLTG